jgi:hypothetical protein
LGNLDEEYASSYRENSVKLPVFAAIFLCFPAAIYILARKISNIE